MLIRITIAVQDAALRTRLQEILARPDILVHVPRARKDVWERLVKEASDVLIVSQSLIPKPNRQLKELQNQPDSPAVIVLAEGDNPRDHAQLLAAGYDAALSKGLAMEQVCQVVEAVLEKRRRLTQRRFFAMQPLAEPRLADFVSKSPAMTAFMKVVPRLVQSDSTLLIEGETGVGKERLANAIHAEGPRAANRFVAINCGALPEHLLESELFGHVRGAFTGATAARRGWFEVAHRGTLFLDEIGEIPLHLQVKLLRVLQEQEIQPVGGEKSLKVDVRVIAASNRPLQREVEAKRFRQDLFYRLSVVTVTVPPLRDRHKDIPGLVERRILYLAGQLRRPVVGIHPHALQALCRYPWPGNVRELNNVLERALLLCDDTQITLDELPDAFMRVVTEQLAGAKNGLLAAGSAPVSVGGPAKNGEEQLDLPPHWLGKSLRDLRRSLLSNLERQYIEGVLVATQGRIGEAAKRVGLSDRALYDKMHLFGLQKEHFRDDAIKVKPALERRSGERRNLERRGVAADQRSGNRRRA